MSECVDKFCHQISFMFAIFVYLQSQQIEEVYVVVEI